MKFIIVFALLFVTIVTANDVEILEQNFDNIGVGDFKWLYANSDGQKHEESGQLKNAGSDDEAISVSGQYSYVGDDGVTYSVNYIADENGFQPQGEHIPKA